MARSLSSSDSSVNSSDLEYFKNLDKVSNPDYNSSNSDSSISSLDLQYFEHLDEVEQSFAKRISRAHKKKKSESIFRTSSSKQGGYKKGRPSENAVGCVLGSKLSEEQFYQFLEKHKHLEKTGLCRLPRKDEAYASESSGPFQCFFIRCVEYGLRFPLRSFVVDLIEFYEISFSQVTPQGWRLLALFAWACDQQNVKPTSELFRYFYLLMKNHGSKGCFYTFSRRSQESIPSIFSGGTGLADEKRGWKHDWFFYSSESWPIRSNRWVILESLSGINSLVKLKLTMDEWKFVNHIAARPFQEINVVWKNMLENEDVYPLKYRDEVEIPESSRTIVPFPDTQTKPVLIPDSLRGSPSCQTPVNEGNGRSKRKASIPS